MTTILERSIDCIPFLLLCAAIALLLGWLDRHFNQHRHD